MTNAWPTGAPMLSFRSDPSLNARQSLHRNPSHEPPPTARPEGECWHSEVLSRAGVEEYDDSIICMTTFYKRCESTQSYERLLREHYV